MAKSFREIINNLITSSIFLIFLTLGFYFIISLSSVESIVIFNFSIISFLEFAYFTLIVSIILEFLFSSFLPKNFIKSGDIELTKDLMWALKEKEYSTLSLPRAPITDKDFLELGVFLSLMIFGITFEVINVIQTLLGKFQLNLSQYFNSSNSSYIVIVVITLITQIPYYNYMIKKLKTRERAQKQKLFDVWLDEQNKIYDLFEERNNIKEISDPNSYLLQMIEQFYKVKKDFSMRKVFIASIICAVLFDGLMLFAGRSAIEWILIYTVIMIGIFLFIAMGMKLINKTGDIIPVKMRTGVNRRMVEALLKNKLYQLIDEVHEYEESSIKNKHDTDSSDHDMTLFWYFKVRLLMMVGKYDEAEIILKALYKKYPEKYLLHGEIANLLAQCRRNQGSQSEADQYENESKQIFTNFELQKSS